MRLIYWLLAGPLMAVAALFAVSNLAVVEVGLWPLPFKAAVPLYLVALGGLAIGFLAGGFVAWIGGGRARARARAAERAVRRRDREIEELRRKASRAERDAVAARTPEGQGAAGGLPAAASAEAASH